MRSWLVSGILRLAQLCHAFVKTPHEIVAKALVGDYRPEHLFTLKQSLDGYRFYKKLITELDEETARLMQAAQRRQAVGADAATHQAYRLPAQRQ